MLKQLMDELREEVLGEVTSPVDETKIEGIFLKYRNMIENNIDDISYEIEESYNDSVELEKEKNETLKYGGN